MFIAKQPGGIARLWTRDEWVEYMARHAQASLKPPASWIEAQAAKGRNVSAATAIWHKRYGRGDQLTAWIVATDDDFYRAGYVDR